MFRFVLKFEHLQILAIIIHLTNDVIKPKIATITPTLRSIRLALLDKLSGLGLSLYSKFDKNKTKDTKAKPNKNI